MGVVGVLVGVDLGGFGGVVHGVMMMAVCDVGMVSSHVVIARFEVTGGFAMMAGRVFVVFGCFVVMLDCFVGHRSS